MRKLEDLDMTDCGRSITITLDVDYPQSTTVTGPLCFVQQHTDWITEQRLCDQEPTYAPGKQTTELKVGAWSATLGALTECEMHP
ncbi:hypothetical protein [Arthrobacter roseus]|uniref:hypothetical protein n=1 Tax=Arthrobacter roseus TaxID=136274 RepID=UPI0019623DC5|nr:hypothetical protein [Arthrobacter roseus]MBM7847478.1 hypothetical protein [Arthrobacter roseus]